MHKLLFTFFIGMAALFTNTPFNLVKADNYKLISYTTEDNANIEAALFKGKKDFVVVFAHGAVFNKESWYFMAKKLQSKGIASLCIDFRGYGKSTKGTTPNKAFDILGAVTYLKKQGFKNIALVGGSMGGKAILDAIEMKKDIGVNKVVLLSPAGGIGIVNKSIKKLFFISKDEELYPRDKKIFDESSQPKQIKIFPGTFHAQNMFKATYRDELKNMIFNFLIEK